MDERVLMRAIGDTLKKRAQHRPEVAEALARALGDTLKKRLAAQPAPPVAEKEVVRIAPVNVHANDMTGVAHAIGYQSERIAVLTEALAKQPPIDVTPISQAQSQVLANLVESLSRLLPVEVPTTDMSPVAAAILAAAESNEANALGMAEAVDRFTVVLGEQAKAMAMLAEGFLKLAEAVSTQKPPVANNQAKSGKKVAVIDDGDGSPTRTITIQESNSTIR